MALIAPATCSTEGWEDGRRTSAWGMVHSIALGRVSFGVSTTGRGLFASGDWVGIERLNIDASLDKRSDIT
jgi:hypothetical protein